MSDPLIVLLVGSVVLFLAGLVQGITGSGYALVAVPILVYFIAPKTIIPMMIIHGSLVSIAIIWTSMRHLDLKWIIPLIIGGVIGMPFGVYLLIALDESVLRVMIGAVITLFAASILLGVKVRIKHERRAFLPVGIISGLLSGSIAMSGPPVILFLANQRTEKQKFRVNQTAYFVILNLLTIPLFAMNGLMTADVLKYALYFLPALALGGFVGMKLVDRIDEDWFRRIVLIVVILAGLFSVVAGLQ